MWSLGLWVVKATWWEESNFSWCFGKISSYRVRSIIYVPKIARRKDQAFSDKTTPQEVPSEGTLKTQAGKSEWVWLPIKEGSFCSWPVWKDIFPSAPSDKTHVTEQHWILSVEVDVMARWPTGLLIILFVPPGAKFSFLWWFHYPFTLFRKEMNSQAHASQERPVGRCEARRNQLHGVLVINIKESLWEFLHYYVGTSLSPTFWPAVIWESYFHLNSI